MTMSQLDVLESLEERVVPSLATRVTRARGDAAVRNTLRIALYSQDSLGLGHLRRTTHIGWRLLEAAPESAVLLFADSPVAPFFELPDGMDCVKLPSILKVDAGQWRPTSLPIPTADLQRLRSELLYRTLVEYQPDLVLVDHMPGGAQGELRPALAALRQGQPACRIVLGLRDVLDAPHVTRRVWQDEGAYEAVRQEVLHEAEGLPVQIVSHVDGSMSVMAAADLVVCMAGYNTLAEVVQLGRKALVVPRAGPSAEQQMRCRLFEQRNLIDVLYPGQLSPQTLAERLLLDLERDDYPAHDEAVDTHGVHAVAALLLKLAGVRAYQPI